jgi:hypothetical protein
VANVRNSPIAFPVTLELTPAIIERIVAYQDVQNRLREAQNRGQSRSHHKPYLYFEKAIADLVAECLMKLWPECKLLTEAEQEQVQRWEQYSELASQGYEGGARHRPVSSQVD